MQFETELTQMADAVSELVDVATADQPVPEGGSLTVVGTGIRALTQLTLEAVAHIRHAESLLHVIGDPFQEELLLALNPVAQTLTMYYGDDTNRGDTYEAMIQHIVTDVTSGKRTVAAFYGHPGVFVYPTHESVRRVRAAGFPARMLPAVSAEDCLVADLGVDPGDGFHAFEATDFLYRRAPIDPTVHLVIWQVGALGNDSGGGNGYDPALVSQLARKLGTRYGPMHPVTIYAAPFEPSGIPTIMRVPIVHLARTPIGLASTLYVPPLLPIGLAGIA